MKKYIFLAALLPMLALYLLSNISNTEQSTVAGDKFYRMLFLKDDKLPLEEIDSNWKYLASFEQATSNSTSEDIAHTYSSIANGKEVPDVLRELAQYLEVMNSFHRNNNEIDNDKINNLQSSSVYPYSSKEAIAIAKIRNSDITGAVEILHSLLNDRKCPTLIKANAQELLRIYDN